MRARIVSFILPAILIIGISVTTAAPAHAATGDAATVFAQTNAQRAKAGLKPLISDATLDRAAQAWANYLASSCTFKHSTSTWRADRVAKAGWSATGENIAAGYSTSSVVSAWMGSSGHRANILNSKYTGLGVGYAKGSCYSSYWVQIFGWTKTAASPGAGDTNGDFDTDILAVDSEGRLIAHRGNGHSGWDGSRTALTGWSAQDELVTLGDFTGDGVSDVGRLRADGGFELLRGTGSGTYAAPITIATGWGGYTRIIGGLDFNGDRKTDILGVTPAGSVMMHRGDGKGKIYGSRAKVGSGWASALAIFYVGDFNADSRGDVVVRKSDRTLWLYPTTGTGRWGTPKKIAGPWLGTTAIFGPGDFNGDGKPDVMVRKSDGSLVLHRGNGRGGWGTVSVVARGWDSYVAMG